MAIVRALRNYRGKIKSIPGATVDLQISLIFPATGKISLKLEAMCIQKMEGGENALSVPETSESISEYL